MSKSDVIMAAAAAAVRQTSEAAVESFDTKTSVKTASENTEQHVVSIVADGDDSVGTSGMSHVSFFTSFLRHFTLLLQLFEMLVDTDDDDIACKYFSQSMACVCQFLVLLLTS